MSDEATVIRSQAERLADHFPTSVHKKVNKGGSDQTYIPWTDSVDRLNAVLGADWSYRIIREGLTATEAWALGEITATVDGTVTTRQQYGCESITVGRDAKPVSDLFKKAGTDALRKASTLFGVGLYLSIKQEREEVEADMRAEVQASIRAEREQRDAPKAPAATPVAPRTTQASRSASTPTTSPAAPTTSSTTATNVENAAILTGATPINQQTRWARLVTEAERLKLPTLGTVKAIDPKACGDPQLKRHADRLEARLYQIKEEQGAA